MRIKVTNKDNKFYNKEFEAQHLNYDLVKVKQNDELINFSTKEVSLIPENIHEKTIISYRDILKIQLNKYIYLGFYTSLVEFIKEEIDEEPKKIEVLEDKYNINKRGIWEKDILIIVNNKESLHINAVGKKYSKNYHINIIKVPLESFIERCMKELDKLKIEIEEKSNLCNRYEKAIETIIDSRISSNNGAAFLLGDNKVV